MCCKTAGNICYEQQPGGFATCMKPGMGKGKVLTPSWAQKPALYKPGTSMFCYSTYFEDMGPKAPENHQLALFQKQAQASLPALAGRFMAIRQQQLAGPQ